MKPYCNKTGVQITEITWDVVTTRRYSYEIRMKSMASKEVIESKFMNHNDSMSVSKI